MFSNRFFNSSYRFSKSRESSNHTTVYNRVLIDSNAKFYNYGFIDSNMNEKSSRLSTSVSKKNKYKWQNQNSKLVKVTECNSDTNVIDSDKNRIVLNHVENHYKIPMPFSDISSKGWISQIVCDTNCINSTIFDLKSCCFISNKYLPLNTLNLKFVSNTFSDETPSDEQSRGNRKQNSLISLSKHKLIRKEEAFPEPWNTTVMFRTRRKLIRKLEPRPVNDSMGDVEGVFKKLNKCSLSENQKIVTERMVQPLNRFTKDQGTAVSRTILNMENQKEKSVSKLVVMSRNKLIRSSLLKGNIRSPRKSVLYYMIQHRRRPYSGSSYVLLSRNKLIRQKSKLKWRKNSDGSESNNRNSSNAIRPFVSFGGNKLIRKSLFSKSNKVLSKAIDQSIQTRKSILSRVFNSPSKRIQRFTNHLSRISMKYAHEGKIRYLNKCKNNKLRRKKSKKVCPVYQTKGICSKYTKKTCYMVHDRKYVALCHKKLKGNCENTDCQLSHDIIPQKVPNCLYYLRSTCTVQNCIYLHTKPDPKADICKEFLRGYCELAEKCSNWHLRACPSFKNNATCEKPDRCRLPHRRESYFETKLSNDEEETNGNWRYFDSMRLKENELIHGTPIVPREGTLEPLPDFIPL